MRKLIQTIVAAMVIMVIQAAAIVPSIPAADAEKSNIVHAAGTTKINHTLKIDFTDTKPVKVAKTVGDFDTEVLVPLRAAQAAAAKAQAEVEAAAAKARVQVASVVQTVKKAPVTVATGDAWEALRLCEAGGDYTKNTGNGYYGAYQYAIGTWANYGGYARPDLAPASVQDAKARESAATSGFSPWPACAARLGLL